MLILMLYTQFLNEILCSVFSIDGLLGPDVHLTPYDMIPFKT